MNDPGLDNPIQENAKEVEQDSDDDESELERQDEQTFLNPRSSVSRQPCWKILIRGPLLCMVPAPTDE
ncbi:hypothetical protein MMC07_007236 [Pseudocyphellaria aurata]|nr:hypothetical protein [Pseudocyphellaria aurata]